MARLKSCYVVVVFDPYQRVISRHRTRIGAERKKRSLRRQYAQKWTGEAYRVLNMCGRKR